VSPGVAQFVFTVYVAAPMPGENGYLRLDPASPVVAPGAGRFLSATVVSAAGTESQGSALTWSSSDTTVARVAADGTVTGVASGTAVITASDGARSGATTVTVGPVDGTAPTLTAFSFTPRTVNAGDTVRFTITASDAGVGVRTVQAQLRSPSGSLEPLCSSSTPTSGTPAAGSYVCRVVVPPGAPAGTWTVGMVQLADHALNVAAYATTDLVDARFATTLTVNDATPDATLPALNGFTLAPSTVTAGDSVTATFTVADGGTGVASARVTVYNAASDRAVLCSTTSPATGTAASGTFQCRMGVSTGAANGSWSVSDLQVADRTGNVAQITAGTLASRGFPSSVTVSGGTNDVHKPTLTSITLGPSPATRADSITVTVGMADPESGAASVQGGLPHGRAPAGSWTLYGVDLTDGAGNQRVYQAGDLKALGYATTLTVTP
jgi:hypothetical protein